MELDSGSNDELDFFKIGMTSYPSNTQWDTGNILSIDSTTNYDIVNGFLNVPKSYTTLTFNPQANWNRTNTVNFFAVDTNGNNSNVETINFVPVTNDDIPTISIVSPSTISEYILNDPFAITVTALDAGFVSPFTPINSVSIRDVSLLSLIHISEPTRPY